MLRSFSKIYGLAGLRVGYALAPAPIVTALAKVRRAFDVTAPAQEAALASLDDRGELARRRDENRNNLPTIVDGLRSAGLEPAGLADVGEDARPLFEALLQEGVIVRPTAGFGAPEAIRVTVGTAEENAIFADALARVRSGNRMTPVNEPVP